MTDIQRGDDSEIGEKEEPETNYDTDDNDIDFDAIFSSESCIDDDTMKSKHYDFNSDDITRQLNELSIEEREKGIHDIYGIREIVKETPTFVNDKLNEFDIAISSISADNNNNNSIAFNHAYTECPEYIQKLRLMFLRSERFDSIKAAKRMIEFFTKKAELFGMDKLTKDITLNDLNDDDIISLECGFVQILPSRDRAGRAIMLIVPVVQKFHVIQNLNRATWYVVMSMLLEDDDIQKNGTSLICCNIGPSRVIETYSSIKELITLRHSLPDRIVSVHFCYDSNILRPFLYIAGLFAPTEIKARARLHFGTLVDINYELSTYGIPCLPLNHDGSCLLDDHETWLCIRREQEEEEEKQNKELLLLSSSTENTATATTTTATITNTNKTQRIITMPRRFDVLFGRGKTISEHTGNLRVGHLVHMYSKQYEEADKVNKTQIAINIIEMVHESNGRFLKRQRDVLLQQRQQQGITKTNNNNNNKFSRSSGGNGDGGGNSGSGWIEVSDDVAREKVSHFFRKLRSTKKQQQQQQQEIEQTNVVGQSRTFEKMKCNNNDEDLPNKKRSNIL